jgi:hypothetical protein
MFCHRDSFKNAAGLLASCSFTNGKCAAKSKGTQWGVLRSQREHTSCTHRGATSTSWLHAQLARPGLRASHQPRGGGACVPLSELRVRPRVRSFLNVHARAVACVLVSVLAIACLRACCLIPVCKPIALVTGYNGDGHNKSDPPGSQRHPRLAL